MENTLYKTYYESPAGLMEIMANDTGVTSILFVKKRVGQSKNNEHTTECLKQLHDYFNKERKTFSVSLDLIGTDFQKRVWNELLNIPFGKTISYLQLAINLGDKKCIRAAGTANGRNPVSIIVPCHRVIGSNGDLVGYGGGLDKKKFLLEHEGVLIQQELFA
ncbi:MAG: methylated-DNA--[protein]-cysteine S-methyltransferase [Bacteroidetes bacterium]|nr:methylated-DNA--[protein]-cysteine S-methyltransferase [Bacteroidota bacterium]